MDDLLQQVSRARRRLVLEQFLNRCIPCLFSGLLMALVAIAVPRLVAVSGLPVYWEAGWLISGVAGGLLVAGVWTWLRGRSELDAAIEIDKRYDLRARVASSLELPEEIRESAIGQALVNDAMRSVQRIDIGEHFRVRLQRGAWVPLAPALIAGLLIGFVANKEARSNSTDNDSPEVAREQIKKSVEDLRKKIADRRKKAEKKNIEDAKGLLKQIEQGARDLNAKVGTDKKKTLVKLNDLKKQLDKRRKQLGGKQALEQQLRNLKDLGKGPAEKAADAIRKGDLGKAIKEINKLRKQLEQGNLTKEQQKQLADQLGKLKDRLKQTVEDQQQAKDELRRQIEEQRQQGNAEKANELQQKLDKLEQAQQQMNQLKQLAAQMGQAQQAAEQGDQQQAAKAMQKMTEQLEQMQKEAGEAEMLADAMDMIEAAKQGLNGAEQAGDQMGQMPAQGQGFGQGAGQGNGNGNGMGKGLGGGNRPDEKNPTSMRDTRVRQNPGRGASVFAGEVDGPNYKNKVGEAIKAELAGGTAEESDPLVEERLPRGHREHAQEFFQQLRETR